ncbi:uncharacterized protein METZ01_LOCUS441158, partial [marine metagenome]
VTQSGITYTATTLAEGVYHWHVKAIDLAGNESAYSDPRTFEVDTTAPTGLSISIDNDETYSNTTAVTLTLGAAGASHMRFKNETNGSWSSYEVYTTTKSWNLLNTQGSRTVLVQFKDEAGNETDGLTSDD